MSPELMDEIETIMIDHQRTRFAKVLAGMKRGLTDEEMERQAHAAGEPIRADSIAAVRRIVEGETKISKITKVNSSAGAERGGGGGKSAPLWLGKGVALRGRQGLTNP